MRCVCVRGGLYVRIHISIRIYTMYVLCHSHYFYLFAVFSFFSFFLFLFFFFFCLPAISFFACSQRISQIPNWKTVWVERNLAAFDWKERTLYNKNGCFRGKPFDWDGRYEKEKSRHAEEEGKCLKRRLMACTYGYGTWRGRKKMRLLWIFANE